MKTVLISLLITGHAFNDQDRCVCAGYDNGDVKLFDLRNMSLRWETNIKNGVRWTLVLKTWKNVLVSGVAAPVACEVVDAKYFRGRFSFWFL